MKIDITLQDLNNRLSFVDQVLDYADKQLAQMPGGNLRIQHQGKSFTYYNSRTVKGDANGHIITDRKLISDLAQKSYLRKVRQSAMIEKEAIRQLLDNYPQMQIENIYDSFSEDRKNLIKPVALSDEEFAKQWLDKYECPIVVDGEVFHPDFTVLRVRDRKVFYWEHCGLMDKEDYANYAVSKFNKYAKEGIILGKNLFATFETGRCPMDTGAIDSLINAHFK